MDEHPFQSYPKIAESSQRWQLTSQQWRQLKRLEWVVTEKIHGANFSLLTDGQALRCASRKAVLEEGASFFGHLALLPRLEGPARALFALLQEAHPTAQSIQITGELFGGAYPHPDVAPIPGLQPIQTGVYYTPEIAFCAFALRWYDPQGQAHIVDDTEAMTVAAAVGLMYAEPLQVGSWAEANAYPLPFASTLPKRLGLPALSTPNHAEGVVLKPRQPIVLQTPTGPLRPILKRKIEAFAEARFHQASKWGVEAPSDDPLGELEWRMLSLVNPNRLQAAASKIGALSAHTQDAICQELQRDVWEALEDTQAGLLRQVDEDDRALLTAVLTDAVAALLCA